MGIGVNLNPQAISAVMAGSLKAQAEKMGVPFNDGPESWLLLDTLSAAVAQAAADGVLW